jgi:hypothetical protein
MPKYMVLYNSSASASDLMANATPEQMKASMGEWIEWRDEASKTIKVDFGMPLQAVSHVTPEGVTDGNTQVSGYAIMEGDSREAVVELVKSHPHLKRPDASIEILEMLSMPGLDA